MHTKNMLANTQTCTHARTLTHSLTHTQVMLAGSECMTGVMLGEAVTCKGWSFEVRQRISIYAHILLRNLLSSTVKYL